MWEVEQQQQQPQQQQQQQQVGFNTSPTLQTEVAL